MLSFFFFQINLYAFYLLLLLNLSYGIILSMKAVFNLKKKNIKSNVKKNTKLINIVGIILSIISLVITILLVLNIKKINVIPTKYFALFISIEIIINLIIILFLNLRKKVLFIIGVIFLILLTSFNIVINKYVKTTDEFFEKGFNSYVTVSTDYIVLTSVNNPINSIDELDKNQSIYYYKYSKSIDLALKELGNYNYIDTDSISDFLYSCVDDDPNMYLLISRGNYEYLMDSTILFNRGNYKIVKEYTVSYKEKRNDEVKDSYVIYLNGVDFTGIMRDFNMLVTVNTKKKQIVLTPVLRGFYIDVPAYGIKDTLMCLGSLDSNVSKEALENLFDIKIDYTVNVNTNSLVSIVDSLGGVDFCSDYSFTTTHALITDSYDDRQGKKLYVDKGCKTYNGVEVLAISRERLHLKNNERGRIDNCKKIMLSIVKKTLSMTTLMNYDTVLNSYNELYTTDMNKDVILNLFKSLIENYNEYEIIEQQIDGSDGTALGHLGTSEVGVTFPNMDQVEMASKKIKEVLSD